MPKLAVIGLGKMGLLHAGLHSALQGQPLEIASEKEGFVLKIARKMMPNLRIYEDYGEMVSKENELEGIIITTPIHTHADIILDILKLRPGLAIFVEKPLAANYEDSERLCRAVGETGSINMVGFQKRFSGPFLAAKQALDKGEIGEPLFFRSHSFMSDIFRNGSGWRFNKESGGVTLEVGPHLLDLIIWYFGEPTRVSGMKRSLYSENVEDYVHATLEFQGRLVGSAEICWSIRNFRLPEVYLEVHGTKGVLTVCDDYLRLQAEDNEGDRMASNRIRYKAEIQPSVPFLLGDPEFCLEAQRFQDAMREKKPTETDFDTASRVNYLMDQLRKL